MNEEEKIIPSQEVGKTESPSTAEDLPHARPEDGKTERLKEILHEEPSTINYQPLTNTHQPSTQNMEVHHHPDLHHKRKHFKEYFLEFLMIFLAVTLGFFAESLREHLNDQTKEKEYIHSLIADLKGDQQVLSQHIAQDGGGYGRGKKNKRQPFIAYNR